MRNYLTFIVLVFGFVAFSAFKPEGKKKAPKFKTYFACKQYGKIVLSAEQFLQYMQQPFCAKDSTGAEYKVVSFEMIYAETGLYQDSTGLPIIHTDYTYGTFKGNTIDDIWTKKFKEHVYKGDTIRFNNVLVKGADSLTYRSSNIEMVLR